MYIFLFILTLLSAGCIRQGIPPHVWESMSQGQKDQYIAAQLARQQAVKQAFLGGTQMPSTMSEGDKDRMVALEIARRQAAGIAMSSIFQHNQAQTVPMPFQEWHSQIQPYRPIQTPRMSICNTQGLANNWQMTCY